MHRWALVVGIDAYERAPLAGAVRDALRVREWLLGPGGVAEERLTCLLAPNQGEEPEEVAYARPTRDEFVRAIRGLLRSSGGKGERLYVFYAGHGLMTKVGNRDENVLLAADFGPTRLDRSIGLSTLWEFLETTQFADQFLFVDACRNVPWNGKPLPVGAWPLKRQRDPGLGPVQQFILYATSPGLTAQELDEIGNERGAFSEVLLGGLHGQGAAKAWAYDQDCYEIRWERLADYVKREMERRRLAVGYGRAGALLQIPQDAGARGVADRDRNPVVTSVAAKEVAKERLGIVLAPDDVAPLAQIHVLDGLGNEIADLPRWAASAADFELPPRTYAVRASAPEYDDARPIAPIELYAPWTEALVLRRARTSGPDGGKQPATLVLRSRDELAVLELTDETGKLVAVGHQDLTQDLPPGFYRVRLRTPEAVGGSVVVALAPGEREQVVLEPPPPGPGLLEVVKALGGKVATDGAIELEGLPGPMVSAQLSTLLAVAAGAALTRAVSPLPLDLGRAVGEGAEAALLVLLGVEHSDSQSAETQLGRTRIRVWPIGRSIPRRRLTLETIHAVPRLAWHGLTLAPGPHWVALETPVHEPLVFAVHVLPGRATTLVLQAEPGGLRSFAYLPSLAGGPSTTGEHVMAVEHVARLLLAGTLDPAEALVSRLADTAADDPLAACLAGYVHLRLGDHDRLDAVASTLIREYPELPDAHILLGEREAARGKHAAARTAYAAALAAGVPIFAEGLTRMLEGARAYHLRHRYLRLVRYIFTRHATGSMWSAHRPQQVRSGQLLVP